MVLKVHFYAVNWTLLRTGRFSVKLDLLKVGKIYLYQYCRCRIYMSAYRLLCCFWPCCAKTFRGAGWLFRALSKPAFCWLDSFQVDSWDFASICTYKNLFLVWFFHEPIRADRSTLVFLSRTRCPFCCHMISRPTAYFRKYDYIYIHAHHTEESLKAIVIYCYAFFLGVGRIRLNCAWSCVISIIFIHVLAQIDNLVL